MKQVLHISQTSCMLCSVMFSNVRIIILIIRNRSPFLCCCIGLSLDSIIKETMQKYRMIHEL